MSFLRALKRPARSLPKKLSKAQKLQRLIERMHDGRNYSLIDDDGSKMLGGASMRGSAWKALMKSATA